MQPRDARAGELDDAGRRPACALDPTDAERVGVLALRGCRGSLVERALEQLVEDRVGRLELRCA